jgi:hypothetical protein
MQTGTNSIAIDSIKEALIVWELSGWLEAKARTEAEAEAEAEADSLRE